MKRLIFYLSTIFLFASTSYSQKVNIVENESQADVNVFVVPEISQCDLKVHVVSKESQANKDGLWYIGDFDSPTDVRVFITDHESRADLKICYVYYETQAGWKNPAKENMYHLQGK